MYKIKDILSIQDDIVFGGAVQTDWFYTEKSLTIAKNFVFHGLEYHGVSDDDIKFSDHQLLDTCSYTKRLLDSLYNDEKNLNRIIMTIAGYGTGKSHLAVTLGELFSNKVDSKVSKYIIQNLKKADRNIAEEIRETIDKENLVIVLNGMNDFNLNYEILSNAKKILDDYGYNEEFFSDFTKAYDIAQSFLKRNFENFEDKFIKFANEEDISTNNLLEYLSKNPYKDEVFNVINKVYNFVTSDYIRWDSGISVKELLKKLTVKLCGSNNKFNKVLILFDEFGRYIEYAAAYPNRAGDSAIQQIFEAVQDSEDIIFNGFIQSDLKTYLSRVDKSSSISRFIGRYESGEKIYLSCNLETIFANLIQKKNTEKYDYFIENHFEDEQIKRQYLEFHNDINDGIYKLSKQGVWKKWDKFYKVIVKGIYPFHPLTVYSLTALSDWYQQRSALNFLIETFKTYSILDISELGEIPQIRATEIIKGDFFEELLLAEKEGRQKSENCILYDRIITKHNDKISEYQYDLLAGLLIYKIIGIRISEKEKLIDMIGYLTGLKNEIILSNIKILEDEFGVISYDESNNVYDFIEDAVGINDFKLFLKKKKNQIKDNSIEILFTSKVSEMLGLLNNIKSDFNIKKNISTKEWEYKQDLLSIENFNSTYIENMIKGIIQATSPSEPKGRMVYLYNNSNFELSNIDRVILLIKKYEIYRYPVIISFLDDADNKLYNALLNIKINNLITQEEKIKFSRHIIKFEIDIKNNLEYSYSNLLRKKQYIDNNGIYTDDRLSKLSSRKFSELYNKAISFPFDGFANKNTLKFKKMIFSILRSIANNMFNYQWIETQDKQTRTRIQMIFKNENIGWGVLSSDWKIVFPKQHTVKKIFNELNEYFEENGYIEIENYYNKYIQPPYGMNDYSFILLITLFISTKGIAIREEINKKPVKFREWGNQCFDSNKINFEKLLSTRLSKVDLEGYFEKYVQICTKIEQNENLMLFPELSTELKSLMTESEVPEELIDKLEMCKYILEDGMTAYKKSSEHIRQLKNLVEIGMEEESYKKILTAMLGCRDVNVFITGKEKFKYTQEQLVEIHELEMIGRNYIEANYLKYIKCQSCSSYAQLSGWEKWMRNLEESLRKIGYNKLAIATKEQRHIVTDNINIIKDKQNVIEDSKKYLSETRIGEFTSSNDLIRYEHIGKNLLKRFSNNRFLKVDYDAKKIYSDLKNRLRDIKNRRDEIKSMIVEISNLAFDMKTVKEAKITLEKTKMIMSLQLTPANKEYMKEIGDVLENFYRDYNILMKKSPTEQMQAIDDLMSKYSSEEEVVNIIEVINDYSNSIQEQIKQLNNKWSIKFLSKKFEDIKKWNANECATWLAQTEILPSFLYDIVKKNYYNYKKEVIDCQSALKLDSVYAIFENLKEEEKKMCVFELMKKVNITKEELEIINNDNI